VSASRKAVIRASGGTNKATSVGVRTAPRKRGRHDRTKLLPASFWHQNFGLILVDGVPAVPFINEDTCRRVAARTPHPKTVSRTPDGLWVFTEGTN
jgi:hypothetical protein